MAATYCKIKDTNDWGLRVEGARPRVGARIEVTKKSGETSVETVGYVYASKGDVHYCRLGTKPVKRRECACSDGCCEYGCSCARSCNCKGGPIWNC